MSSITIENWKVTDDSSPEFELVPPEYHVTYWEIPKWWYKGDEVCYTSCVRIDVGQTSVYVDGTSPLMKFTLNWEAGGQGTASFTDWRCIDRALILEKDNLGAVNRDESDEYIDVEFNDYFYKIRYDNYFGPDIEQPLQGDIKPVWVNGNNSRPFYQDPIPFITGTFIGGVEPVTYEVRHKELVGNNWNTPTNFSPQTNTPTERTLTLDPKTKAQKIHIETRATDAEGTKAYCNGPYLDVNNPLPTITTNPTVSIRNLYQEGQILVGFAGDFEGGLPDARARCRWQHRASKDAPWSSFPWTQNVSYLQQVDSLAIPVGTVQVRLQYQVIEDSTNTGSGPRNTNNAVERDISPAPATTWGAVIINVNDVEYNYFIGAPVTVTVGQPINMKVEWEGNATGTVQWGQRPGGSAFIDDPQNFEPEITMTAAGGTTVTVTLTDPSGQADPTTDSKVVNFYASPA
jgi:hypothetical protein